MDLWDVLLLFGVGIISGIINTLAGGGSLLTLPVLIFLGLSPNVANATNRIGVFFNGVFAIRGYMSKGLQISKYSYWLGLAAFPGAFLGAILAAKIEGALFNKILAAAILVIVAYMLFGPKSFDHAGERTDRKTNAIGLVIFFFIGLYGGFIQAGVGYLIMAALSMVNRFSLLKTNAAKAVSVLIYTLASLIVFIYYGIINWELGIALAVGNSLGGWLTSRWSVGANERWIRYFVMITAIAFAIKLFFF